MNEKQLKTKIVKKLKQLYGSDIWVYHPVDVCHSGIPDLIICLYGRFIAIELKAPGRKAMPDKLQAVTLKDISRAAGESGCFNRYENAIVFIQNIIGDTRIEIPGARLRQ